MVMTVIGIFDCFQLCSLALLLALDLHEDKVANQWTVITGVRWTDLVMKQEGFFYI